MSLAGQSIDLLYEEPQARLKFAALERALSFAFAAGDTSGLFGRALEHASSGGSSFDESCFRDDLFIDDLLDRCMAGPAGAPLTRSSKTYVKTMLCAPPKDSRTTRLRQGIMAELLGDAGLRQRFEDTQHAISEMRGLLELAESTVRYDIGQRRIDVLRCLKTAIDRLAEGFGECRSELSRLSKFGRATQQGTGYQQLAELLAYEDDLATLDLRVRVGVDGRLRSFEVLGHRENRGNAFHEHWLSRLWRRLWMLLRGYRFGEQEILMRLTDHVFEGLKSEVLQLFQLLGDMDFYRAGLGLAQLAQSQQLAVCLPTFSEHEGLTLEGVFNPFLVAQGVRVRRCNLRQETPRAMTVITGPNSGGKTRLLQSLGLCQLLGQAGLPVPAKAATLCWTRGMFVSIVQETSADQREGRLGTELLRIRRLFERVTPGDVIVLDELCSGTNPSEGEEIFRLVIELLAQLEPQLWLTTHFLQFAARLKAEAALVNLTFLQVELDAQEQPTYGFVPGVAQSSLAGQTAERLGVTWQELSALVSAAKQKHA